MRWNLIVNESILALEFHARPSLPLEFIVVHINISGFSLISAILISFNDGALSIKVYDAENLQNDIQNPEPIRCEIKFSELSFKIPKLTFNFSNPSADHCSHTAGI